MKTKIIYFGTDEFVIAPLRALLEIGYEITAVVTTHGNTPVKSFVETYGSSTPISSPINVLQPQSLKDDEFFEEFKRLEPELCVIASYGKIIPQRYLEVPRFGFINLHPSLLPKYRGPSPVPASLLAGDKITGMTIIKMDTEMDHGPIIAQQEMTIEPSDNFITLILKLFDAGAKLLTEILPHYLLGEVEPHSQEHELATYTKLLKTEDAEIRLDDTVEVAINKIRALNPEPGTFVKLKRQKEKGKNEELRLKILEAERIDQYDSKMPILKLQDGYLFLKKVQPEGKKPMAGEEFMRGYASYLNL